MHGIASSTLFVIYTPWDELNYDSRSANGFDMDMKCVQCFILIRMSRESCPAQMALFCYVPCVQKCYGVSKLSRSSCFHISIFLFLVLTIKPVPSLLFNVHIGGSQTPPMSLTATVPSPVKIQTNIETRN